MPRRAPPVEQSALLCSAFAVLPRPQALRMQRMRAPRENDWIAALTSGSAGLIDEQSACTWCERSLPLGHFDDSRAAFTMIVSKIFIFRREDFGIFLAAHRRKTLRQLSILRPRNV